MKTFETPFVDVKKFDVEDVLTTSSAAPEEEAPVAPSTTARVTVTDTNGNVYVMAPPCL